MKPAAWYDADGNFVAVTPHADSLVNWANANDGRVFGHVMLWHSQIPTWFFEDEDGVPLTDSEQDQEILKDRIAEHIDNVAKYFAEDRKSTRLNSSHVAISYAVFCLKKK